MPCSPTACPLSPAGTLADSGVDDHTVNAANLIAEFGEYLGHPLVVVDVQLRDSDLDVGIPLRQFGFQFGQPIRAAGAERQVAALGGEGSGHPAPRPELAPVIRIFWRVTPVSISTT